MQWAQDNAGLLANFQDLVIEWVLNRLLRLARVSESQCANMSPETRVKENLVDPIRIFVKNELHKLKKIKSGGVRLIWSISIVDQLIERTFYNEQNKIEIDRWTDVPSKPGMPLNEEGFKELYNKLKQWRRPRSSDMSGWDLSVQPWQLHLDSDVRADLQSAPPSLRGLFHVQTHTMGSVVAVLSNGLMLVLELTGVMKSGRFVTSSTNSRIRAATAYLLGAREAVSMGDDCEEDSDMVATEAEQRYGELGHTIKDWSDEFQFCSRKFGEWGCYLTSFAKVTGKYLSGEPSLEKSVQWMQDTKGNPEQIVALVAIRGTRWDPHVLLSSNYGQEIEQSRYEEQAKKRSKALGTFKA